MLLLAVPSRSPVEPANPGVSGRKTSLRVPAKRPGSEDPLRRAVVEILSPPASGPAPDPRALTARLVALGELAAPSAAAIACGLIAPPDCAWGTSDQAVHPAAVEARERLLIDALAAWNEEVVARVLCDLALETEPGERLAVVRVLGRVGTASAQEGLFEVLSDLDPTLFAVESVSAIVEEAFERCLRARPAGAPAVVAWAGRMGAPCLELVARCARRLGGATGVRLLASLLGRDAGLDRRALGELSTLLETPSAALGDWDFSQIRWLIDRVDPEISRGAIVVLGRLCDRDSFPSIAAQLEHQDRLVAGASRWSLRAMSRTDCGASREAWNAWFDRESAWWDGEAATLIQRLHEESLGDVREALAALVDHALFRHEIAQAVGPLTVAPDAPRALLAISALERIGSPRGAPWLVRALAFEDERREPARSAARALTGLDLGFDPAAWTRALGCELP